jgi:CheY-like chemotaxis protein
MAKPASLTIPTEPIGSIPRPVDLIERVAKGDSEDPSLAPLYEDAIRDTIERFDATGSPVITDGEQRKHHNFVTYCVHGLTDEAMSDLSGVEFAREIRGVRPELPIVLMSGYSGAQLTERAQAVGVAGVLRKPLVARDIAEALGRALQ